MKGNKPSPLLEGFAFLKNVKFHSVALCESKDKERRGRRIVLLPRHMKVLLNSFDEKLKEERNRFAKKLSLCAKVRRKLQEDIKHQKEEYENLSKVNEQLMKNIKDKSLKEFNRSKQP